MDSQAGGGAVLGVAFMRVHQPRIAYNMAGYGTVGGNRGGHFPDATSQTNPNMMQMGQSGGNGNTPTNVPSSTQNTPLTPSAPGQLGTAQPGTTLTQPVTNPTQPIQTAANQANPNTQANAPGSPQDTPLQNNTGTVYLKEKFLWHKQPDKWDLNNNDKNGGHIRIRHLVSKESLIESGNNQTYFKDSDYFSAFENEAILTKSVRQALQENSQEIDNWLLNIQNQIDQAVKSNKKTPTNFRLSLESQTFLEPIGFGLQRNSQNFESLYKIRMILEMKSNGNYYIFTAYPIR